MERFRRSWIALLVLLTLWPTAGLAQGTKVGVVTTLEGSVTATRVARAVPLKFKDDVLLQDKITTAELSIARLLLDGKAVVTVRERSTLTITEVPGRSTVDLDSGKLALAVAREKMRPGETVELRTPNAVAGVRGTVLVVEILRASAQAGGALPAVVTTFYVLRGSAQALQLDPATRAPIGPPIVVNELQSLRVSGTAPAQLAPIPPGQVAQIVSGLQPKAPQHTEAANREQVKTQSVQTAEALLVALVGPAARRGEREPGPQGNVTQAPIIPPIPLKKEPENKKEPEKNVSLVDNDNIRISGVSKTVVQGDTLKTYSGSTPIVRNSGDTVIEITNKATVTQAGADNLIEVKSGTNVDLSSVALLKVADSTVTAGLNLLSISDRLVTTTDKAFLSFNSITMTNDFVSVSGGQLVPRPVTETEKVLFLRDNSRKITAPNDFVLIGSGGSLLLAGPLLTDSGGTLTTTKATGSFVAVDDGGKLTSTTTSALLAFDRSTVSAAGTLLSVDGTGTVNLDGPLLSASTSDLTVSGPLLKTSNGGQVVVTGSTDPFVSITGNLSSSRTHSIANTTGTAMFELVGRSTKTATEVADGVTLTLGTDKPLQLGTAPLLRTAGASILSQKALLVDTAFLDASLLTASAPLINLTSGSNLAWQVDAIDLKQNAKITSAGPILQLEASQLTVRNGALIRLAGGSFLKVTGDLIKLGNGTLLSVNNGPLIDVSGGSVLNVSGALMNFGSSATLTIRNDNPCGGSCPLFSGIQVKLTDGATTRQVSIGPNPIKNGSPFLSSSVPVIVVSGTTSKVTITAP